MCYISLVAVLSFSGALVARASLDADDPDDKDAIVLI